MSLVLTDGQATEGELSLPPPAAEGRESLGETASTRPHFNGGLKSGRWKPLYEFSSGN